MATLFEVASALTAHFVAQVGDAYPVAVRLENDTDFRAPRDANDQALPWVEFRIRWITSTQATIGGAPGRYRTWGEVVAGVRVPAAAGARNALLLAQHIVGVYRAASVPGVNFEAPAPRDALPVVGEWRIDVYIPFYSDEVT